MTIYVDIIIIENLIMNFIILYATGLILKNKISFIRLLLASLIGAIYSALQYISNMKILSNIIIKTILSIIIINIETTKKLREV